jgi:hypothetical protein
MGLRADGHGSRFVDGGVMGTRTGAQLDAVLSAFGAEHSEAGYSPGLSASKGFVEG